MDLNSLILLSVVAGYGDPVQGYPSAEERSLVLWTNAARVAPREFTAQYKAGGCSLSDFSSDEKTAKAPLYIDIALTRAARAHSKDMHDNGCFSHESCDGTDTWKRINSYYKDAYSAEGENIAYGSADAQYTVMSMWMCSHEGHRANIMSGDYNEMGGGIKSDYMTQDFAGGELTEGEPPVRVAAEYDGKVYADWGDDSAPSALELVVDGKATDMSLENGDADNGIYAAPLSASAGTAWFVRWETRGGDSGEFPATGAFEAGKTGDNYDSSVSHKLADAEDTGLGGADTGTPGGATGHEGTSGRPEKGGVIEAPKVLCASSPGGVGVGAVFAGLAVVARRRSSAARGARR